MPPPLLEELLLDELLDELLLLEALEELLLDDALEALLVEALLLLDDELDAALSPPEPPAPLLVPTGGLSGSTP